MDNPTSESYQDTLLDRLFIWIFSRKMAKVLGRSTILKGYEGFVDISRQMMEGRSATEQKVAVASVLTSLMPPHSADNFRRLFPPNQRSCEINAWLTKAFLSWLVGYCELTEVEVRDEEGNIRTQKSGVQIKKCRYLEQSRCVGMCTNMCKLPTQEFFTEEFGLPLTMTPNFEDLSCEMVFGQVPLPLESDPVYSQPCFSEGCTLAKPRAEACPQVRSP